MIPKFSIDYRDHEIRILARHIKDLANELKAYHDRAWTEPHDGVPDHEAGECPGACAACNVLVDVLGAWPW